MTGPQEAISKPLAPDEGTEAQFELAMQCAARGEKEHAVAALTAAAQRGHGLAEAQLGLWQVLGTIAPLHPREGLKRIRRAARAGNDIACLLLAGLHAQGTRAPQDWAAAADWLIEAARLGNVRALTVLSLVLPADHPGRSAFLHRAATQGYPAALSIAADSAEMAPGAKPDFAGARAALDLGGLAHAPPLIPLREAPRILSCDNFLPPIWCRYVQALGEPLLQPADVHNAERGRIVNGVRTNSHMAFGAADTDPLIALISHRIAAATGIPVARGEDISLLRYRPGEFYARHVDFFDPAIPALAAEAKRAGQRVATFLIYLNDGFAGGETEFPLLRWRFKGQPGTALAFWNVHADGSPDRMTVHAGLPTSNGEKWILSKWLRDRAQSV